MLKATVIPITSSRFMSKSCKAGSANVEHVDLRSCYRIGSIVLNRQKKFWLQSDFIFKMTNDFTRHEECIKILHGFSYRVIRERKQQIKMEQEMKAKIDQNNNMSIDENGNRIIVDDEESLGKKKRLAFLDLLITASGNGSILNDEDIREEVDTFVSFSFSFYSRALSLKKTINFRCLRDMTQHQPQFLGACS